MLNTTSISIKNKMDKETIALKKLYEYYGLEWEEPEYCPRSTINEECLEIRDTLLWGCISASINKTDGPNELPTLKEVKQKFSEILSSLSK